MLPLDDKYFEPLEQIAGEIQASEDLATYLEEEEDEFFNNLKEGKIDIVIGTHAILNKKIGFKDLGLLVIDEEQKFGVAAKEKLRGMKVNVDTLTLTATPIPRTLQFSLMAARDLSVIRTPPPNRQPIHTEMRIFSEEVIKDAIYYEINRGGQVFFVHNRVKTLPDITAMIRRMCPDVDIASAHGQLDSKVLEKTLLGFIDKQFDVLVCTNIIETGLDIANANTIIINNAHQFGMSDLHQLRGRVGRSNKKAFCYLFSPPQSVLTPEARKRLQTLEEYSELGSGFNIAMKDLEIRGAGDLLGGEQSGFINEIGFETYQKILSEAIDELKETEFKELYEEVEGHKEKVFVKETQIDSDFQLQFPDDYINNITERLNLYTELNQVKDEEGLQKFEAQLIDRFGELPSQAEDLLNSVRIKWIANGIGLEKVVMKKGKLIGYFITDQQSEFYQSPAFTKVLQFVQSNSQKCKMKEKQTRNGLRLLLVFEGMTSLDKALNALAPFKNMSNTGALTS